MTAAPTRSIADDIAEATPADLYRRMLYHQAAGNRMLADIYGRELASRHAAEIDAATEGT